MGSDPGAALLLRTQGGILSLDEYRQAIVCHMHETRAFEMSSTTAAIYYAWYTCTELLEQDVYIKLWILRPDKYYAHKFEVSNFEMSPSSLHDIQSRAKS